jgi:hypothetical protein
VGGGVETDERACGQDKGEDAGNGCGAYGTVTRAGSVWRHCAESILLQSGVDGGSSVQDGEELEEMPCQSPADTSRRGLFLLAGPTSRQL